MTHSLPMIDLMDFCWKGQARDNLKKPLPGPIEMGMILEPKSSVPYYPPQHFRGPGWNAVVMPMIATAPNPEDIIVAQEEEPASA